ncbi:MAG: BrnT family toxin [Candidatus Binataceae bacterium]
MIRSDRKGEKRYAAMGLIAGRLHVLIFTKRGPIIRVISLRHANKREVTRYEEAKSRLDRP